MAFRAPSLRFTGGLVSDEVIAMMNTQAVCKPGGNVTQRDPGSSHTVAGTAERVAVTSALQWCGNPSPRWVDGVRRGGT